MKPISVEHPFQQWCLDFIGEINPILSSQHKWIPTATYYFIQWVEAIPTRPTKNIVIIDFLLNNIISIFPFPRNLITNNAQDFKSNKMVILCSNYNNILSHSTTYYPQGNGLEESSNKSLVRIIKMLLQENKMACHINLDCIMGRQSKYKKSHRNFSFSAYIWHRCFISSFFGRTSNEIIIGRRSKIKCNLEDN